MADGQQLSGRLSRPTIEHVAQPFLQSLTATERVVEMLFCQGEHRYRTASGDGGVARRAREQRHLTEKVPRGEGDAFASCSILVADYIHKARFYDVKFVANLTLANDDIAGVKRFAFHERRKFGKHRN